MPPDHPCSSQVITLHMSAETWMHLCIMSAANRSSIVLSEGLTAVVLSLEKWAKCEEEEALSSQIYAWGIMSPLAIQKAPANQIGATNPNADTCHVHAMIITPHERNHLGDLGPGSSLSPLSPPLSFLLSLSPPLSFLLSLLSSLLSFLLSPLFSPLFPPLSSLLFYLSYLLSPLFSPLSSLLSSIS